jgi:hypothetical protein
MKFCRLERCSSKQQLILGGTSGREGIFFLESLDPSDPFLPRPLFVCKFIGQWGNYRKLSFAGKHVLVWYDYMHKKISAAAAFLISN